jgi:hypothetical protein
MTIYASYTKYKRLCPHCGQHFQTVFDATALRLGPGIRTCYACGKAFSDSSLEWPEMTTQQKRRFLFGDIVWVCLGFVGLLVVALFAGVPAFLALGGVFAFLAAILAVFYIICGVSIAASKLRYRKRLANLTGHG